MLQLVISIVLSAIYTVSAFLYFKKKKLKHSVSMLVFMGLILLAFSIYSYVILRDAEFLLLILKYLSMIALCVPIAWIDFDEKRIPNELVLCGLIVQIVFFVVSLFKGLDYLLGDLKSAGLGLLLVIVFCGLGLIIIRNGIGMGDVKLLLVLALMGGLDTILSVLFFTMVAAFFMGLYELVIKKKGKTATIPFAPAILFGVIITLILTILS